MLTQEDVAEALAIAAAGPLQRLAEAIVAGVEDLVVLDGPTVGTARYDVREPVESIRFGLTEVLVTRAEVELDGVGGWAMRLGDDRAAVLAAAVCDAEVQRQGPHAGDVLALCSLVRADAADRNARRWAELRPTIVNFEELD
jgi:alpha-D-ribose 1-methylphosphonate 5-triphosphate synthase subunit PhnG